LQASSIPIPRMPIWSIWMFKYKARFIPNHKTTFSGTNKPECFQHMVIDDDSRRVGSTHTHDRCDSGLAEGWYRFINGKRMSSQCAKWHFCNTDNPGWLVGGHPSVSAGRVTRKVCFGQKSSSCCSYHTYITVRNCGSFYVYKLKPTPRCYLRYCTI